MKIIWRIRFAIATAWIFRKQGFYLLFGWKVSGKTKYKHLEPYEAALEEIGEWYE